MLVEVIHNVGGGKSVSFGVGDTEKPESLEELWLEFGGRSFIHGFFLRLERKESKLLIYFDDLAFLSEEERRRIESRMREAARRWERKQRLKEMKESESVTWDG